MTDYQPPTDADEPPADRLDIIIGVAVVVVVIVGILWGRWRHSAAGRLNPAGFLLFWPG